MSCGNVGLMLERLIDRCDFLEGDSMARRKKIVCPECEKLSSIDLKQCGNTKPGGVCTFNTYEYWEHFSPWQNLLGGLIPVAAAWFLHFYGSLPALPNDSVTVPILRYLITGIHYLPLGVLALGVFFLGKSVKHFWTRPKRH